MKIEKIDVLSSVLLLWVMLLAFATPVQAQQNTMLKNLPDDEAKIVEALGRLATLPDDDWKSHVGDVPHGEDMALDDHDWKTVHLRAQGPQESMWFRRWIEVPKSLGGYDLTNSSISLKLQLAPNIMTAIVYINGRRSAMGEDLETIPLFDHARPGDKALVAIKLLRTATPKSFSKATLHVVPPPGRPSPEDLHDELITASEMATALSSDSVSIRKILRDALDSVDLNALHAGDQKAFDHSLLSAQQRLKAVRPELQRATFVLNGQSHIDAAYRWPWTEAVDVVHRTFGTALQLMDEYPTYTFTQSSAIFNEWMADKYPILDDEIKRRIKEGRWEIVGGMWVEGDFNLPGGESIVRQLLIGKRWYQQHYGVDVRVGWNPDSFGFNWQLPQIYKKAGVDYFVTHKMAWNESNKLPFHLFWWKSPDGSRILTYFPPDFASTDLSIVRLSNAYARARATAPGLDEVMDLYGVGDHGGGPTRNVLDQGLHWMEPGKITPKMRFGTALSFFHDISPRISPESPIWNYKVLGEGTHTLPPAPVGQISIPTWNDELYLEYHRGTYTTQADLKRNLRRSEQWLLNAEQSASLAWLSGDPYPTEDLNEAWKKALFNDFHDIAAGSGVATIYRDAARDFKQVHLSTQQIQSRAMETVAAEVDTHVSRGVPLLVFNPVSWQRSGPVEVEVQMPTASGPDITILDEREQVVPSEVLSRDDSTHRYRMLIDPPAVPSVGYVVFHAVPGRKAFSSPLKTNGLSLENDNLRVVVDPATGCITSLYDKRSKFEALAKGACGNELIAYRDVPKAWDAWNIDADFEKVSYKLDKLDSIRLIESGPLRAIIRITRSWQNSKFSTDLVLYANADYLDVIQDVDWHENHILLKAAFPLAATSNAATYEIPYGTIERPTTRNNSWEDAKFEVPAIRWADLGDGRHGFSLINESKYGYDAKGNVLRISLLRSPLAPDPDADRGLNHFSYALYPHAGDWRQAFTVRRGYEYNYQLQAMQVAPHVGTLPPLHSFVNTHADNVVLTTVKKAEDYDGLVLRFYDWAGKDTTVSWTVPKGVIAAHIVNLLEQPQGGSLPITNSDQIEVPVHPFEIQSVRLDYRVKQAFPSADLKGKQSSHRQAEAEPEGQVDQ